MTDDALFRSLEREAAGGDPVALSRLLAAEVRAGRVAAWQEALDDLLVRARADVVASQGRRHARMSPIGGDRHGRLTTAALDVAFGQLLGIDPHADGALLVARAWDVTWGRDEGPLVFGMVAASGRDARTWLGVGAAEELRPLEDAISAGRPPPGLEGLLQDLDRRRSPAWRLDTARSTVLAWLACASGASL